MDGSLTSAAAAAACALMGVRVKPPSVDVAYQLCVASTLFLTTLAASRGES